MATTRDATPVTPRDARARWSPAAGIERTPKDGLEEATRKHPTCNAPFLRCLGRWISLGLVLAGATGVAGADPRALDAVLQSPGSELEPWALAAMVAPAHARDRSHDGAAMRVSGVPDPSGALIEAARRGDTASVRALLEAGAAPDQLGGDGSTALVAAIRAGSHPATELLLAYGASADGPEGAALTPLVAAVLSRNEYAGHRLLNAGARVAAVQRGPVALDPLVLATEAGLTSLVARIESGTQDTAMTPARIFEQALAAGSPRVFASLFSSQRLSPNDVVDVNGTTIAMALLSAEPFSPELWAVTDAATVQWSVTDPAGRNLGHLAASRGLTEVIKSFAATAALRDRDALTATDQEGRTPLWYAVQSGDAEAVAALLDAGADPTVADRHGVTPLAEAERQGSAGVTDLLREALGLSEPQEPVVAVLDEPEPAPQAPAATDFPTDDTAPLQLTEATEQLEETLRQMRDAQEQLEEAQRRLEAMRQMEEILRQQQEAQRELEEAQRRLEELQAASPEPLEPPAQPAVTAPAPVEDATTAAAPVPPPALTELTVIPTPGDARVRIMNIQPRYRDGIQLTPGAYDIEVSAPGYRTYRRFHRLAAGEQVLRIALEEDVVAAVAEAPQPAVARDRLRDGSEGPELVMVRGGTFRIGSPATEGGRVARLEQQRDVTVSDFWMTRHPITVQDYRRFLDSTGYRTAAEGGSGDSSAFVQCEAAESGALAILSDLRQGRLDLVLRGRFWRRPGFDQGRDHPVVCLTWREVNAYATWLSAQSGRTYRLPTEAEWEYAARAGTGAARPWGEPSEQACQHANVADQTLQARQEQRDWQVHACADGHEHTSPVGTFAANGFGLHDMIGNVWEWTCSAWGATYGGQEQRCATGGTQRALRGGSWTSAPDQARSASRMEARAESSSNDRGFRLVRMP